VSAPLKDVTAVVLAAGAGSRFAGGKHKLLQPIWGRPLVAWSLQAAVQAGCAEVVVVEGAVDLSDVVPSTVIRLVNDRWAEGQAGSLALALAWCLAKGRAAAVVGLGDQPLVPASAWRAVAESTAAPIVAASYGGQRRNPVRLARSVWPLLPAHGDEGARLLMARRPDLVAEVACEGVPADIDTAEDLAALQAAYPFGPDGPRVGEVPSFRPERRA
jgi:molybdenum cofactor cytidylyltransferase